ncbi:hypothetical protein E0H77_06615 [Acinetobacter sp. ANC 4633]|uniref:hypothetical protein n=1 Tax=Acinetobacter sp. ANC 4633 TaxID=2529845 RepID=UPI00103D17CB|nr:hypothetical protein [Acinetobacter sp. ANC 4633]TCB26347.1 hypothetical protein E0H77_06615 [Acinetobacter sp. ANC 4633]
MANILIRTSWNTNNYQKPAGVGHLAENQINYVSSEGFGAEEWNFNKGDLVGDLLYGYIRPDFKTLVGKTHNIYFYTRSPSGELFLVGHYTDAYFLTNQERYLLRTEMDKQGLVQKRIDQVYTTLQSIPEFQHCTREEVALEFPNMSSFKLQVKPENAILYSKMRPFSEDVWNDLSPDKKLCRRYRGYNHIPNLKQWVEATQQ